MIHWNIFKISGWIYLRWSVTDWILSGGFTPCCHLRPSSGREHSLSSTFNPWWFLMNETRRKPSTETRCPTLFDKWHGIVHMPSHTDTAWHTLTYPDRQGLYLPYHRQTEPMICQSTVQLANHCATKIPRYVSEWVSVEFAEVLRPVGI